MATEQEVLPCMSQGVAEHSISKQSDKQTLQITSYNIKKSSQNVQLDSIQFNFDL